MKRHKMLSSMELIDEKFVEEASPQKNKSRLKKLGAIAAAAAIMITSVSVWLFTPFDKTPPDVSGHQGNQYYPLIQKLNQLTFKSPNANNRYDLYFGAIEQSGSLKADEEAAEDATTPTSSPSYVETTDNQVSGVTEADLIKRTDKHIFYLRRNVLSVYPLNGTETEAIATYKIETGHPSNYCYSVEMFLSPDCTTLSVILPCYSGRNHFVQVVTLNVSDPTAITESGRATVSGTYVSARFTAGKLLLVTNYTIIGTPDFNDESTFIPEVKTRDGIIRPAMRDILCPDNAQSLSYAVVTMLNPESTQLIGTVACLSYSYNIYVSADSIYLTRSYSDRADDGNIVTVTAMSDITRVAYSDSSLEICGTTCVPGTVKDQYSLDEYEGVLRVATTTRSNKYSVTYSDASTIESMVILPMGATNVSLYCLDKYSFEMLAAVESFAPEGEELRSARFDGDMAYICTSVQLSDPVFFFDLSDLDNITYKDTGTIEGFSSSLINFGDGYLLGVGVGSFWDTVKIEVYAETESGVMSVCSKEIPLSSYSDIYKSYFIDREQSLFGLMIATYQYQNHSCYYLLLHFDGATLTQVLKEDINGNLESARAVLADGCFYILTDNDFAVKALN